MPQAPKPADEKERVASLHKLNILDTPLEHRFESITRMVCMMLNVPVSAFTLIDAERRGSNPSRVCTPPKIPCRNPCALTLF